VWNNPLTRWDPTGYAGVELENIIVTACEQDNNCYSGLSEQSQRDLGFDGTPATVFIGDDGLETVVVTGREERKPPPSSTPRPLPPYQVVDPPLEDVLTWDLLPPVRGWKFIKVARVVSASGNDKNQFKRASNDLIEAMKRKGVHPHDLKPNSKYDLFVDPKGNISVRPRSGEGPGEPTGYNIRDFEGT
jgi:hypothetical protein